MFQKQLPQKIIIAIVWWMIGLASLGSQNLYVDKTIEPDKLIKDVLVSGACLNVDNVRAIGNGLGLGYYRFEGAAPIFEEGIMITSGDVKNAIGPNFSTNISEELLGHVSDKDLDLMASDLLFDATGIEFDFVPFDSFVEFRFIFASEEYCEFVGSEFNDVFGFFVSGPGINGTFSDQAINVARIPGSDDLVSINSVNHLKNSDYYIPNETRNDATHCRKLYEPQFLQETEYDGFTKPIRARFKVIPCETYHIRLVVADVADGILDSGVFLEARSFSLGGKVTVRTIVEERDSQMIKEGCSNAYFLFERVNQGDSSLPLEFTANISGLSTAQAGVDYSAIPNKLTIPAFTSTLKVPIETYYDQKNEPLEEIFLELELPCKCSAIQAAFQILNTTDLEAEIPKMVACRGAPTDIVVKAAGGVAPYQYVWSNQSSNDSIIVVTDSIITYQVTVTDACSQEKVIDFSLDIVDPPAGLITENITICDVREDYFIPVNLTGEGPWDINLRIDNHLDTTYQNINQTPFQIPILNPGQYELISVSNTICAGSGDGTSLIEKVPLELKILDCSESETKKFEFSFSGVGSPTFSIDAGNSFQPVKDITSLETNKAHRLLVQDEKGCTDWQTIFLPSSLGYQITIPTLTLKYNRKGSFQPRFNFPIDFIGAIRWFPNEDLDCSSCLNPTVTGLDSRQYRIDITDKFGCLHSGVGDLVVDLSPYFIPNAFTPFNKDGINDKLSIFIDQQNVVNVKSFDIFDRWGNQVFNKENFLPFDGSGWDGNYQGSPMQPGVFAYRIAVELIDGRVITHWGDVTLVD